MFFASSLNMLSVQCAYYMHCIAKALTKKREVFSERYCKDFQIQT